MAIVRQVWSVLVVVLALVCDLGVCGSLRIPLERHHRAEWGSGGGGGGAVPLRDHSQLYYVGTLQLGQHNYTINFDTGSANLFVLSSSCWSVQCRAPSLQGATRFFDPVAEAEAGLFWTQGVSTEVTYGSGWAMGFLGYTTVGIGGVMNVSDVGLLVVVEAQGFDQDSYDGLCGMGWPSLAQNRVPTLMERLRSSGVLGPSENMFSMFLSDEPGSSGEMTIGGWNEHLFKGPLQWTPVTDRRYWQVAVTSLATGTGEHIAGGFPAIVDSGTSMILCGPVAAPFIASLPSVHSDCSRVNRKEFPDLVFEFSGGFELTLGPEWYIVDVEGECVLALEVVEIPGVNQWILGDAFLRAFYTVYDFDGQVGFAEAIASPQRP